MKLAITGGTGFVGSHLIDAALAAGHEVKALTRREQPDARRRRLGARRPLDAATRSSGWSTMPTR